MADGREVKCVMCQRSEETSVTGPMSTKDGLTAHQNCLLFASGLYCKNTPEFDDLFGFSVEDVRDEVNRGNKLTCRKCKKRGAAAGCEVRRCKKSYHYPCAVEDKAKITEDPKGGLYGLFCPEHYPQPQGGAKNDGAENGMDSDSAVAGTSNNVNGAGSSKRNSSVAGESVCSSDSSSSSSGTHRSPKKRLRIDDRHKIPLKRILSDSSSCSEEDQPNTDMNIFAPIESDFDESANSVPGQQVGFILFLINIIISRP
ncbi:PHD finger protein 6-like isoform X3 [Solea solea]|uniref:PHD finger protein 6-like isoform X3 n=1 Tax=Solea solea TaxID=90069 RepID=UPI00272A2F97|nr:PHD finger protein 6-like isoform X3 [Solea solea]